MDAARRDVDLVRDYLGCTREQQSPELVRTILALTDDHGGIAFTTEFAEAILLTAEEYFEHAFAAAAPGPDLDFLRSLVPYVWARWR